MRTLLTILCLLMVASPLPVRAGQFVLAEEPKTVMRGAMLYVPVYSKILLSAGRSIELAATVSIRNADPERPIFVRRADYYDNDGNLVRSELNGTHRLAPMSSTYFFVKVTDTVGGIGANYVIEWVSDHKNTAPPVIEAVMIGETGTKGLSFSSPARVIRTLP